MRVRLPFRFKTIGVTGTVLRARPGALLERTLGGASVERVFNRLGLIVDAFGFGTSGWFSLSLFGRLRSTGAAAVTESLDKVLVTVLMVGFEGFPGILFRLPQLLCCLWMAGTGFALNSYGSGLNGFNLGIVLFFNTFGVTGIVAGAFLGGALLPRGGTAATGFFSLVTFLLCLRSLLLATSLLHFSIADLSRTLCRGASWSG